MTLTAMRPDVGLSNGREVSLWRRRPGFLVDLGLERRLQRLVGIVRAEEVGVADEEALLVVVGVDEPAGDAVRRRRCGSRRCCGSNTSTPLILTRITAAARRAGSSMSGSPNTTNRLPLPVFLRSLGHVQVGVHPRLEHRDAARACSNSVGVRVVVEGAGDQHVEAGIARLARGGDQIGPGDRAELRADEDAARACCRSSPSR